MLKLEDANAETDLRIATLLLTLTHRPAPVLPYTRDEAACKRLRELMELEGLGLSKGTLEHVADTDMFIYNCKNERGEAFAVGSGPTAALAICDAFLECFPSGGDDAKARG